MTQIRKPKAEKSTIVKIKKVENALYIDLYNRLWGHFVVAYNDIKTVPDFLEDAKTGDKVYVIGESFKPGVDICEYEIVRPGKRLDERASSLYIRSTNLLNTIKKEFQPKTK